MAEPDTKSSTRASAIRLDGVAVVTGAGQGIGRAIALRLLRSGCGLIAIGRTEAKLRNLAEEAGVDSARVFIAAVDIRDEQGVTRAIDDGIERLGPIAYLVNAAGVLSLSKLLETDAARIREVIDINLTATMILTGIVARHMLKHGSGAIVTIGSNSGTTPRAGLGAYPASKAGLEHAMKCLGLELSEHGIRSNIVSPGSTDTEMQRSYQTAATGLDQVRGDPSTWRLGIPLGRMADPEDIADATCFLLSDMARHITMENIVVDGGATLGAR